MMYDTHSKVRSLLEHSCVILIFFKTKSVDVILKMTTVLKEIGIAQLFSLSFTNGYHTIVFMNISSVFRTMCAAPLPCGSAESERANDQGSLQYSAQRWY